MTDSYKTIIEVGGIDVMVPIVVPFRYSLILIGVCINIPNMYLS